MFISDSVVFLERIALVLSVEDYRSSIKFHRPTHVPASIRRWWCASLNTERKLNDENDSVQASTTVTSRKRPLPSYETHGNFTSNHQNVVQLSALRKTSEQSFWKNIRHQEWQKNRQNFEFIETAKILECVDQMFKQINVKSFCDVTHLNRLNIENQYLVVNENTETTNLADLQYPHIPCTGYNFANVVAIVKGCKQNVLVGTGHEKHTIDLIVMDHTLSEMSIKLASFQSVHTAKTSSVNNCEAFEDFVLTPEVDYPEVKCGDLVIIRDLCLTCDRVAVCLNPESLTVSETLVSDQLDEPFSTF